MTGGNAQTFGFISGMGDVDCETGTGSTAAAPHACMHACAGATWGVVGALARVTGFFFFYLSLSHINVQRVSAKGSKLGALRHAGID